jgi:DNA-binding transcriptional regulator WhiA
MLSVFITIKKMMIKTKNESIQLPTKLNKHISEIAGLFAADGSMQKKHICFWGNPMADKDYYDFHLTNLFLNGLNYQINPHLKKSNQVYGFYICNKHILDFFHNYLNFPIGSKTYTVSIPRIILESNDDKLYAAFLRGYFAGDGSISFFKRYSLGYNAFSRTYHVYPRLQIISVSAKIIKESSNLLKHLGISNFVRVKRSKQRNSVDACELSVYGKSRLQAWSDKIGFVNPNHSTRYEIFKRNGFVPPSTTYSQRIDILKNKLNPLSFYKSLAQ